MTLDEVLEASRESRERADAIILRLTEQMAIKDHLLLDAEMPLWEMKD